MHSWNAQASYMVNNLKERGENIHGIHGKG